MSNILLLFQIDFYEFGHLIEREGKRRDWISAKQTKAMHCAEMYNEQALAFSRGPNRTLLEKNK